MGSADCASCDSCAECAAPWRPDRKARLHTTAHPMCSRPARSAAGLRGEAGLGGRAHAHTLVRPSLTTRFAVGRSAVTAQTTLGPAQPVYGVIRGLGGFRAVLPRRGVSCPGLRNRWADVTD